MFTLKIDTDNAAFGDQDDDADLNHGERAAEVARILRHTAERIENGFDSGGLRDINGNKVGEFSF